MYSLPLANEPFAGLRREGWRGCFRPRLFGMTGRAEQIVHPGGQIIHQFIVDIDASDADHYLQDVPVAVVNAERPYRIHIIDKRYLVVFAVVIQLEFHRPRIDEELDGRCVGDSHFTDQRLLYRIEESGFHACVRNVLSQCFCRIVVDDDQAVVDNPSGIKRVGRGHLIGIVGVQIIQLARIDPSHGLHASLRLCWRNLFVVVVVVSQT